MKTSMSLKLKFATLFLTSLMAFPVMAAVVCPPKNEVAINVPHDDFFSPTPNYDTLLILKKSERPEEFQKAYDKFVEQFGPPPQGTEVIDAFYVIQSKDKKHMAIVYEGGNCVKQAGPFNQASYDFFFGQEM